MTNVHKGFPFECEVIDRYSPIYKTKIKQLTLSIPGGGCKRWLDTKGRCCPFCGFPGLIRRLLKGVDSQENYEGWLLESSVFEGMYDKTLQEYQNFNKLAVFNGGSFFFDTEIPSDFRKKLYKDFSCHPVATQLMVESIPEGVTEEALEEAKTRLGDKEFMIGIGLESSNNKVRNKILRKATSLKVFEKSVQLMQSFGVQVFVYVFLKGPGMSEKEAYEDVLQTMTYLNDLGVDEMALSCAFIPPNTPIEKLYNNGEFRPPWLWTILKIMAQAKENGWPLSVGGFEDQPPPVAIAGNCDKCDPGILQTIDDYRTNGMFPRIQSTCSCKTQWHNELHQI